MEGVVVRGMGCTLAGVGLDGNADGRDAGDGGEEVGLMKGDGGMEGTGLL